MVIYGLLRYFGEISTQTEVTSNFSVGQCNQPKPVVKSVVNLKPSC